MDISIIADRFDDRIPFTTRPYGRDLQSLRIELSLLNGTIARLEQYIIDENLQERHDDDSEKKRYNKLLEEKRDERRTLEERIRNLQTQLPSSRELMQVLSERPQSSRRSSVISNPFLSSGGGRILQEYNFRSIAEEQPNSVRIVNEDHDYSSSEDELTSYTSGGRKSRKSRRKSKKSKKFKKSKKSKKSKRKYKTKSNRKSRK